MIDDDRLAHLLRSALSPSGDQEPSRDLWPMVVKKVHTPAAPSWIDIGMAVAIGTLVIIFPDWLLFLVYHL